MTADIQSIALHISASGIFRKLINPPVANRTRVHIIKKLEADFTAVTNVFFPFVIINLPSFFVWSNLTRPFPVLVCCAYSPIRLAASLAFIRATISEVLSANNEKLKIDNKNKRGLSAAGFIIKYRPRCFNCCFTVFKQNSHIFKGILPRFYGRREGLMEVKKKNTENPSVR